MTVNKEFFREQMSRLEGQFNSGKQLNELVQKEYFMVLKLFRNEDTIRAIDNVIQTHKPYPSHVFPSVSTLLDALNDVMRNAWPVPGSRVDPDFCEKCDNVGIYLVKGKGKFCDCIRGRKKEIDFGFWPNKKRIEEEKEKIKNAVSPHRDLKERNPVGLWELTKDEHEKWMTAKRAEIAEMDARTKDSPSRKKGVVPVESIKRLVEEKLRQVRSNMSVLGQKSDAGLEEEPFERRI
jgi:hypothetical protein